MNFAVIICGTFNGSSHIHDPIKHHPNSLQPSKKKHQQNLLHILFLSLISKYRYLFILTTTAIPISVAFQLDGPVEPVSEAGHPRRDTWRTLPAPLASGDDAHLVPVVVDQFKQRSTRVSLAVTFAICAHTDFGLVYGLVAFLLAYCARYYR